MSADITLNIAQLRSCVAFLGEKENHNWWSSSFLSSSGGSFLTPVFPKTSLLARVNGASAAAQLVHDEHIGVGNVYHLFRLPENIEHEISQSLTNDQSATCGVSSVKEAKACFESLATGFSEQAIGPLLLEQNAFNEITIKQMASAYLAGFQSNEAVYPYYRGGL